MTSAVGLDPGFLPRRAERFRTSCATCDHTVRGSFEPTCSRCGGLMEIWYDLAAARIDDEASGTLARFRDLLPVADGTLLPEDLPVTPAVHATRLGDALGLSRLYLKDETVMPTGTTKDRMAAVALAYL